MKIVDSQTVSPIRLMPGDVLTVTWTEPGTRLKKGKRHELAAHTFEEHVTVDRVVIAKLETGEAQALGFTKAYAAIVGTSV